MPVWNPWHGCIKISEGCKNCYVYRRDSQFGKDSSVIAKTNDFNLPLKRKRNREYKLVSEYGDVFTCMTSDFFLEQADSWRDEAWNMMRLRRDLNFIIITKRIYRFMHCIPWDWGEGYDNVSIMCTCENQKMADYRLPLFIHLPIRHKYIIHEPMLESVDIEKYLKEGEIEMVLCGGESGESARLCDFEWVLNTRKQCIKYNVSFNFRQTGALFRKDGRVYKIKRIYQHEQAKKAGIDYKGISKRA